MNKIISGIKILAVINRVRISDISLEIIPILLYIHNDFYIFIIAIFIIY